VSAPRVAMTVTLAQERAHRGVRHHLHPATTRTATPAEVATAHAGLHAARLPTPYVTLRSRLPAFAASELRRALAPGGGLVKMRTCRRTLHIYPLADAAAAHVATLRQRLGACAATVRRLGHDPAVLARLAEPIRDALTGGPLGHRRLEEHLLATWPRIRAARDVRVQLARLAVKWLWESGELTYRNTADSLHRERREFHLTTAEHPTLLSNRVTPAQATVTLLRRYLAAFGPASMKDFRWWSGLTQGDIAPAVTALEDELLPVRLDGRPDTLWVLAEHEAALRGAEPLPATHVGLLAYEDPSLKGYFATRYRYVDDHHRATLFNSIGEVHASIAVAGRCVGTWRFDRRTRTIEHRLFADPGPAVRRTLDGRLAQMTEFLRSEPC
jgi:hypothetical protein